MIDLNVLMWAKLSLISNSNLNMSKKSALLLSRLYTLMTNAEALKESFFLYFEEKDLKALKLHGMTLS